RHSRFFIHYQIILGSPPVLDQQSSGPRQKKVERKLSGIHPPRRRHDLRDIVAHKYGDQDQVRLIGPNKPVQNKRILAWARAGDAEIVDLGRGESTFESSQVIIRVRDRGSDRERVTKGSDTKDPGPFLHLKVRSGKS